MNYNITPGEYRILKLIVESEYHDGRSVIENPVWQVTETKEDSGFLGSLVKKGLAGVDNTTQKDATCWITYDGMEAFKRYPII